MKPKALILSGYAIQSEEESKFCFETSGGEAQLVHINDLIENPKKLDEYQILMISGGFSYGDHTGAGKALANKILNNLREEFLHFVTDRDTLTIGVCNGFQVLTSLGICPAVDHQYGKRQAALMRNDSDKHLCHWVNLKATSHKSILTQGLEELYVPISHGEGKFFAEDSILDELEKNDQIAFTYTENPHDPLLPSNPNGSLRDIAGVTDPSGRVLGMMPHIERTPFYCQRPDFTNLREKALRCGEDLPKTHPCMRIFENAVGYFN